MLHGMCSDMIETEIKTSLMMNLLTSQYNNISGKWQSKDFIEKINTQEENKE